MSRSYRRGLIGKAMTLQQSTKPFAFALACAAVYGAAFYIAGRLPLATNPEAVAVGLTLDLTVLVPALYYALLVRGRGWPAMTTALVFLASLAAAAWVVPPAHQELLHALQIAGVSAEVLLTGYVVVKAARTLRRFRKEREAGQAGDVLERWRAATRAAFDVRPVADVLAYEAAVFYYAAHFLRPGAQREAPGAKGFTYHRTNGYGAVVFAVVLAALMEMVAGHVLLRLWSETAAWVHLALGLYGLLWLLGDFEAMRHRFIRVGEDALHVRAGLRWSVRVPLADLAAVEPARRAGPDKGELDAVIFGGAQLVLRLRRPVLAEGPYGITKHVTSIRLRVDEPARFEALLRERGAGGFA